MKLYIKTNNLKILKNLKTLLPNANAKAQYLLDENSNHEYHTNLNSARELQEKADVLFFEKRGLDKLIKGIYFGNSSCEHLLPNIADIVEAQKICEAKHYNFVFVFPPLSSFKMDDAVFILKYLAKQEQSEVVVNDIGTLQLVLRYDNLKPILGLNFTKVIKNAFIDTVTPTDLSQTQLENQTELLSHLEFEIEEVRAFYKEMGIGRFGIENIGLNLDFLEELPKMQCDFYYPHITLANSKACDIAGAFEDQRSFFVQDECPKYCNYASLEFSHTTLLNIHQRYNTVYKTNFVLNIPKSLYKHTKNRLVWEIFI